MKKLALLALLSLTPSCLAATDASSDQQVVADEDQKPTQNGFPFANRWQVSEDSEAGAAADRVFYSDRPAHPDEYNLFGKTKMFIKHKNYTKSDYAASSMFALSALVLFVAIQKCIILIIESFRSKTFLEQLRTDVSKALDDKSYFSLVKQYVWLYVKLTFYFVALYIFVSYLPACRRQYAEFRKFVPYVMK